MCNLMKVQSSFQFKKGSYKVQFAKKGDRFVPVVKKLVGSILGVKLWREDRVSTKCHTLSNQEAQVLRECPAIKAVTFLRTAAQNAICVSGQGQIV